MASYLLGSCICEKVKYKVKDDFISFKLCHCRLCQKASGSSNAANAFTSVESIRWLQGETQLKRFDVPNSLVRRVFCKNCGTSMPFITQNESLLVIPVGTLSSQPKLSPQEVRYWHERMPWYDKSKSLELLISS